MENVKVLRRVKKISNTRNQHRSLFSETLDDYDHQAVGTHKDYFSELSDEIILNILKWIPKPLLLKYAIVCKRWYHLMFDQTLWRRHDLANKIVNAEMLIKLLNRGIQIFGLGRSDLRKSSRKRIVQGGNLILTDLASQIDFHLNPFIRLECIDLTNAFIDTNSLNVLLKHCKYLEKISIEALEVNNETMLHLSNNKKIDTLNLCLVRGLTVDGLVVILNNLKCLTSLNVGWANLDRESVALLCKYLPSCLERLNLTGCKTTLLDSDVENLAISCPNLIELDLSDAQSITGKSVEFICNGLCQCEYLAFSRCYSILPSSYLMLNRLNNLIAIDIFNILKEKSIETLRSCIPSLQHINSYPFSSIARPIVGFRRSSIWGRRIRDDLRLQLI